MQKKSPVRTSKTQSKVKSKVQAQAKKSLSSHAKVGLKEIKEKLLGRKLPAVTLATTDGDSLKLPSDLKDQWTILYFYPRDNTPGCTKQACEYRDQNKSFASNGIRVLGVSSDSLESHQKFTIKYSLNFPLISDPDKKLSNALGVIREKSLYGRKYMGVNRDTFLIDPKGIIREVWRKVDPTKSVPLTLDAAMRAKGK